MSTFSGVQSYHEMLKKAQSTSPALTYILCSLLLEVELSDKSDPTVKSRAVAVHGDEFKGAFHKDSDYSRMSLFLKEVFGRFNAWVSWKDQQGESQYIVADKQFVRWLQSDVVEVHSQEELVTIKT